MGAGGRRPGAGRKKGGRTEKTLERDRVHAALKQRIMQKADQILNAQFSLANGISFLYRIEKDSEGKNKKAEIVTDSDEIREFLDAHPEGSGEMDDAYYYITASKPDAQILDSLLNRAFGKPTETHEISGTDGAPLELAIRLVKN